MKKLFTLAFSIIFTMTAFGQRLEYERSSNWFFGLNAGATWNTTDVQNKTYAGWGFLLGRSFNYDYGRRISYDLRLRYLRGRWYGQDTDSTNLSGLGADYNGALSQYKEGLGYTVNNFEANVHELGLELAIHFNRFRDRTGWDPYIFGGANISWNETYGDLIDQDFFLAGDSLTYAYDQIAMNKPAIEQALDENYETALDGTSPTRFNANFMPSLGIGLAYDFGPRFQMGIEHKTTFTLKDDFDGYADAEPNWGFLENDVYHYTSAFMRWRFRYGGDTRPVTQPQPDPTPVIGGGAAPCQLPEVRVTRPLQRTETVQAMTYVYKAEVRYVQSRNQIVMRVNGIETTNFLYNPQTHELESYLYLQPGNNTIEVTGRNTCGTDTETSTLIYNDCIDPVVYFENVCSSTFTAQVDQRSYIVQAQISNATNIEFTVNGVRSTNFTYNSATGDFRSTILLNQGQNTIRITATNGCGTDTGTSVVTYTDCPDPIVNFVGGNGGFISVSQANYDLNAYIYNVTNKNNINVRVNGSNRNFNFNTSTKLLNASLMLTPGQNKIIISATTSCGTDTETLTVDYTPCMNPTIQLVQPISQSTTTTNGTQLIQASMFNVANISQIQLFVNGNLQQGGTFNAFTKMFEANVALNSGFNTIQITVLNDCGADTETISVNYNPCSNPDVQMILPSANGGLTSSPSQLVQAIVFNASNVSEIQTYVNGTLQNGGTFDVTNGLYQNTVALNLGVNTIQVVATNGCGSDVQTVTITYRACEAPQITMTSPTSDPLFTTDASVDVAAMIGSITNTSQVQLTVNGVVDASGATYSSSSITYSNNVNLNLGNNTIVITATNSCGTVSKEISIVREVVIVTTPTDEIDSITICFVHSNNVGDPVTMVIPLAQWPTYQSIGAQLGPCPVVNEPIDLPMTICFKDNGNAPTTMQILTSEWPAYQAMGATEGPCPEPTMTICFNGTPLIIPASQWSTYQGQGATEGPCPIAQEETVLICVGGSEMTIPVSEWPAYQIEGAELGPCPTVDPEMVICIEGTQRTILTSQWPTYQAQGATQGPCPVDEPMEICMVVNGVRTTMTILTSEWPSYQAQGAMAGPCPSLPDPSITICMPVNGVPTTMTILTSEWPSYQSQGATQGPCPAADPQITICLNNSEMTILTSEWPTYQAQGATLGACPQTGGSDMITICHKPPGNPTNTQEIQIPLSAWPAHQAHGDVMGPCVATPDPEITICLNGTEQTILTSEWATYQAQGATQGPCPVEVEMIEICVGGTQMTIPASEWQAYQIEGATLGPCPTVDPPMTICIDGTEKTILTSDWAKYQAQGATEGPCPVDEPMQICMVVNGVRTTLDILTSEWPSYQAQGAMQGPCPSLPDPLITICTEVNGVPTTMSILTSEWPAYQAQGATQGPCPAADPEITICLEGTTRTILTSQWATYQAQGADLGPCVEDPDMVICVPLNGVRRTITIKSSQWPTYQAQGAIEGECPAPPQMTICLDVNGVPTTMLIDPSQWASYQAQGASVGACVADSSMTICVNGETKSILVSEWPLYDGQGATQGPCPDVSQELVTICFNGDELEVLSTAVGEYVQQGATVGPCPTANMMTICITINDVRTTMEIPTSAWATYQAQGATEGPCQAISDPQMTICLNGNTKTILVSEWAKYQAKGATIGACIDTPVDTGGQGVGNSDTLNGNIGRPTNGGGEDELLFGNRTITICHTPNGSIASQTMQIPLSEWEQYQALGATLGACTGSLNPIGGGGKIDVNNSGNGTGNGGGNNPTDPGGNDGTEPSGGNMPVVGNGSQEAKEELIRKQKEEAARIKAEQEEAARQAAAAKQKAEQEAAKKAAQEAAAAKARQEQAAKDAEAKRQAEEAKRKAAQEAAAKQKAEQEAAKKAAQEAAAAKARQEQAAKDAAAKKAAQEAAAKQKAEQEAAKKAAQEAAAAKARKEQAAKEAAAQKAAKEAAARRQAEEAKAREEKAAREAAARRQAEEAKRKAAQEAAAKKAAQEKAAREAEAKRKAAQQAEEAKRKAAQEAAAAKARQEKAAKEAAAKKAAQEEAKRKAAAKKAAEEAAKKKAEEQRKAKEQEGGR